MARQANCKDCGQAGNRGYMYGGIAGYRCKPCYDIYTNARPATVEEKEMIDGRPNCQACGGKFDNGGVSWKKVCLPCYKRGARPVRTPSRRMVATGKATGRPSRRHGGEPCAVHGFTCSWDTPICGDD